VLMIFNEWNKLIMMSYDIMIFCFWLLIGVEKSFGRKWDFLREKLFLSAFEKQVILK